MKINHVTGKKKAKVMLYALSTCIWCRKTKQLLNDLGIEYDYADVDLHEGSDKTELTKQIIKWNPDLSFPTMVIDDSFCIKGFDPDAVKEKLGS
ncbi:MAG: glutaredoxin family protein [Candidatus Saganbacteria bacterium]|nr:glutaredoxin family protein [Candidatus Saganbacteria bacterium]